MKVYDNNKSWSQGSAPLVSVIIPVYNAELYLEKCVKSITNQTYSQLEIILVNDGSTDYSATICDCLQASESRIRVVHKANMGVSLARAQGLALAKGDYILFVDSDDWLDIETIENCVSVAEQDQVDCVLFSYVKEYTDASIEVQLYEKSFSYNAEDAHRMVHRRLIGMSADELSHPERIDNLASMCMKLYKKEVAQAGRFFNDKEIGTSEDTLFNLYALRNCSISYIDKCFYHYRKDNDSSITTRYKNQLPDQWDVLYRHFEDYLSSDTVSGEYRALLLNRVACGMVGLGLNEVHSPSSLLKKSNRLKSILEKPLYEEAFKAIDITYCPIKWKFFFLLCKWKATIMLTILLNIMDYLKSKVSG